MVSDGDVMDFHLGKWNSKEKMSVGFGGSSGKSLHFGGWRAILWLAVPLSGGNLSVVSIHSS